MSFKIPEAVEQLFLDSDIEINGSRGWDLQVKNPNLFLRVMIDGSLGLGEAYMDDWWECAQLDEFFFRLLRQRRVSASFSNYLNQGKMLWAMFKARLFNYQTVRRAIVSGQSHYDIGNDLFEQMLDPNMVYTCGYWKEATTLKEAQEAKLKMTCEKLLLKPGMRLLDIGCGWGSLMKYAATHYGVSCTGYTVSKNQVEKGKENCQGLDVQFVLEDYRKIQGKYDRVVSLGMFEHVGYKNYLTFMKVAHHALEEEGIFLLHTIGKNAISHQHDPWINKYIFPGGNLPSPTNITRAINRLFVLEDWHNFGPDYDTTLIAWYQNFEEHWSNLAPRYNERFFRMWRYFLLSCAGAFRARDLHLWQIVLTKHGLLDRYDCPR